MKTPRFPYTWKYTYVAPTISTHMEIPIFPCIWKVRVIVVFPCVCMCGNPQSSSIHYIHAFPHACTDIVPYLHDHGHYTSYAIDMYIVVSYIRCILYIIYIPITISMFMEIWVGIQPHVYRDWLYCACVTTWDRCGHHGRFPYTWKT